jgi:hypothetical protein
MPFPYWLDFTAYSDLAAMLRPGKFVNGSDILSKAEKVFRLRLGGNPANLRRDGMANIPCGYSWVR